MTEERLEQIVEGAADQFDAAMNRAWRLRPVRLVSKALSILTGLGLMAGALSLLGEGKRTAARLCFAGGICVVLAELLLSLLVRRK